MQVQKSTRTFKVHHFRRLSVIGCIDGLLHCIAQGSYLTPSLSDWNSPQHRRDFFDNFLKEFSTGEPKYEVMYVITKQLMLQAGGTPLSWQNCFESI